METLVMIIGVLGIVTYWSNRCHWMVCM